MGQGTFFAQPSERAIAFLLCRDVEMSRDGVQLFGLFGGRGVAHRGRCIQEETVVGVGHTRGHDLWQPLDPFGMSAEPAVDGLGQCRLNIEPGQVAGEDRLAEGRHQGRDICVLELDRAFGAVDPFL